MSYHERRSSLIKNKDEIKKMEVAGRIVAETLSLMKKYVVEGKSTSELDQVAEDYIRSKGATPAFKGYEVDSKIFPYTLCISINEEIVHGMPGSRILQKNDVVSIDCGAEKDGYFGDSAVTYIVGEGTSEDRKLLRVTEEALFCGIKQAVENNKLFDVSRAIQEHAEKNGFSLTRELVGHGIGTHMHEEPPVPNYVPSLLYRKYYPNVKLQNGMAIAIEPMVHYGKQYTKVLKNGWTYVTADGSNAAHFEHTVVINGDKALILTLRD